VLAKAKEMEKTGKSDNPKRKTGNTSWKTGKQERELE
jgi:hypothetical protein